ncbi:MAG TPA: hypothetical protein VLD39_12545 [Gammaproteobacteria bacterium]|nr:hypothetical protein [Gammaproteobacteria bacterium]
MRRIASSTVLLVLFVAVQATVVSHLDLDAHSQDTPCALCVGASMLGGANVSSPGLALPEGCAPEPQHAPNVTISSPKHRAHLARAPPLVS